MRKRKKWTEDTHSVTTRPALKPDVQEALARKTGRTKGETDRLVEGNLRLVAAISRKFYLSWHGRVAYEDIFQAGCMGLMNAAKSFDPQNGARFSTYAYIGITMRASRECKRRREVMYIPPEPDRNVVRTDKRPPVPHCKMLRLNEQGFTVLRRTGWKDGRRADRSGAIMVYAEANHSLHEDVEHRDEMRLVRDIMDKSLTERYKTILNLRLEGATLEEAGVAMGLSKERVRQIEGRAIDHIRKIQRGEIPCRVIYTGERNCPQPTATPELAQIAKSTADCP